MSCTVCLTVTSGETAEHRLEANSGTAHQMISNVHFKSNKSVGQIKVMIADLLYSFQVYD